MNTYTEYLKHFENYSPEYRKLIHNAINDLLQDPMIRGEFDKLLNIDALLVSIEVQGKE
jgi:hypothetical protein